MKGLNSLKVVVGSMMFAAAIYAILAAPGFLTDSASTVGEHKQTAVVRP